MIRTLSVCCALVLALAGPQAPAQRHVLVTVMPQSGAPVRDLTAADFRIREGGVEREVVAAAPAPEPLYVSLLVEVTQADGVSGVSNLLVQDIRKGVSAFVESIRAGDRFARVSLTEVGGAPVPRAPFGAPAGDMETAIQRLYPSYQGDAVMLEGIGEAAVSLADKPTPRRAIVVVDFTTRESVSDRTLKQANDRLNASGATVWTVSIRNARMRLGSRDQGLDLFTGISGGAKMTILDSTGLQSQLKKLSDALLSQYIVSFASPYPTGGRRIEVETTKGLKALASRMIR